MNIAHYISGFERKDILTCFSIEIQLLRTDVCIKHGVCVTERDDWIRSCGAVVGEDYK